MMERLYYLLVNRVPVISYKYQAYRKNVHGMRRILAWVYLLWLNMRYGFSKDGRLVSEENLYKAKSLYLNGSESSLSYKEPPLEMAKRLAQYDVISFDVFDTLIFRAVSNPTDLFYFIGEKLNYLDLKNIRIKVENDLRNEKRNKKESGEISLDEIWERMEIEAGIPKEEGKAAEWECEKKFCFANPYMLEVIKELKKMNRKYIVISDMYLSEHDIRHLLKINGFDDVEGCFVSSEIGKSKSDGTLYSFVKSELGADKKYIHLGDNWHSDVKNAEAAGIKAEWYPNINEKGMKYRAEDMSVMTGSIYRGLINTYIHNGLNEYSKAYEFGFIYGGLFVMGYCRWIYDYAREKGIDKILFLARDGDILSKVYKILYPEMIEGKDFEYVYWSRLAATKMAAGHYKYDFFRRFLLHKINQGYSLKQIFASMDLQEMLQDFLEKEECVGKYTEKSILNDKLAADIHKYLLCNWNKVLSVYKKQVIYGKSYYKEKLNGCTKVVAVDVGWAGSGAVTLDYMVNRIWDLKCEVTGLIAGTNSFFSQEPDANEPLLHSGKLVSYMFSQNNNRDLWKLHNPNRGHNIIVELLLASNKRSFRGFSEKGPVFGKGTEEIDSTSVQRGIIGFVNWYLDKIKDIPLISGRDAYAPIKILIENEKWMSNLIISEKVKMNLE